MRPARFVVGLTGGIGTGKSTALAEFGRRGVTTLSLDRLAHEQRRKGREGWKAIVRAFGRGILDSCGEVDRRMLAYRIFRSPVARKKLEQATHPLILREMKKILRHVHGVVVVDTPLLFEAGLKSLFDATVVISCRPNDQLRRLMRRDRLSATVARRRIRAQWPLARKRALADLTLDNIGTPDALRAQVRAASDGLNLLYGGTPNGNQVD